MATHPALALILALLSLPASSPMPTRSANAPAAADWSRITASWNNGSLPPPYRRSGQLTIHADGRFERVAMQGYDAEAGNTVRSDGRIDQAALATLRRKLVELDVYNTRWQEEPRPPVGGPMRWVSIETAAETITVPPFPVAEQTERARAVFDAVRAVEPRDPD
jgi:hypothetical protein